MAEHGFDFGRGVRPLAMTAHLACTVLRHLPGRFDVGSCRVGDLVWWRIVVRLADGLVSPTSEAVMHRMKPICLHPSHTPSADLHLHIPIPPGHRRDHFPQPHTAVSSGHIIRVLLAARYGSDDVDVLDGRVVVFAIDGVDEGFGATELGEMFEEFLFKVGGGFGLLEQ